MTMVERVANGMQEAGDRYIRSGVVNDWRDIPLSVLARAAIEAMRDVDSGSPGILIAGKGALFSCSEDPDLEDARKCWQAMIDFSLIE